MKGEETKLTTQRLNHFVKADGTRVVAAQGIESTHEPIAKHLYLRIREAPARERQRWRHNAQASYVVRNRSAAISFRGVFLRRGEDVASAINDDEGSQTYDGPRSTSGGGTSFSIEEPTNNDGADDFHEVKYDQLCTNRSSSEEAIAKRSLLIRLIESLGCDRCRGAYTCATD